MVGIVQVPAAIIECEIEKGSKCVEHIEEKAEEAGGRGGR